jgi:hypothetical protein
MLLTSAEVLHKATTTGLVFKSRHHCSVLSNPGYGVNSKGRATDRFGTFDEECAVV